MLSTLCVFESLFTRVPRYTKHGGSFLKCLRDGYVEVLPMEHPLKLFKIRNISMVWDRVIFPNQGAAWCVSGRIRKSARVIDKERERGGERGGKASVKSHAVRRVAGTRHHSVFRLHSGIHAV